MSHSFPEHLPSLHTIHSNSSPRLVKTNVKRVSFKPTVPLAKPPKMPKLLIERSRFIDGVCELIRQLHIPIENANLTFDVLKDEYINRLKSSGYPQSYIDNEINLSIVHIMRRLYFESPNDKNND